MTVTSPQALPYSVHNTPDGPIVLLEGNWTDDVAEFMVAQGIRALSLGGSKRDISFLTRLPWLVRLILIAYLEDISPIGLLTNLRQLTIGGGWKLPIDLSGLQDLRECELDFAPGAATVLKCRRLRSLHLRGYKPVAEDSWSTLEELETLRLDDSSIAGMPPLGRPQRLLKLELGLCPKFVALESICRCIELKELIIDSCTMLRSIEALGCLQQLVWVDLTNNGDIESLRPLERIASLERVTFLGSTRIMDGDLSPLFNLPRLKEVLFEPRRHYSHKPEDFEKARFKDR